MYVLYQNGAFQNEMAIDGIIKPDHSYPTLMNLLPAGLKGLSFAALTAAIVASLAGKSNSISTIFSLDIYKKSLNPNASEAQTVWVGRIAIWVSFGIALLIAPQLRQLEQAYQFIQEYSNYLTPGAFALFSLGLFWKRTTSTAAIVAAVASIPLVVLFKNLHTFIGGNPIPFLHVTSWVYVILVALMVLISLADRSSVDNPKGLAVERADFTVSSQFAIISILIMGIVAALYTVFY